MSSTVRTASRVAKNGDFARPSGVGRGVQNWYEEQPDEKIVFDLDPAAQPFTEPTPEMVELLIGEFARHELLNVPTISRGLATVKVGNAYASADAGRSTVIATVMAIYLGGWVLTTMTALPAARTFAAARSRPAPRYLATMSVLAGAIWPLLLLGMAELGSIVTYAKMHRA